MFISTVYRYPIIIWQYDILRNHLFNYSRYAKKYSYLPSCTVPNPAVHLQNLSHTTPTCRYLYPMFFNLKIKCPKTYCIPPQTCHIKLPGSNTIDGPNSAKLALFSTSWPHLQRPSSVLSIINCQVHCQLTEIYVDTVMQPLHV